MGLALLVALGLVVSASALVEVNTNYHDAVGIPEAKRIKETEDAILSGDTKETEDAILSGDTFINPRIVGGNVAPSSQYPYLGGLVISFATTPGNSVCGSSLISANRLVTAAHCWFDGRRQAIQFVVVLGSQFLFSGGTRIPTNQVIMHPAWTPSTLGNDVAVIGLPTRVFFTNSIRPVNLPHFSLWDSFVGEWAWAAGYGRTSDQQFGVSVNTMVSHVQLPVISVSQCQSVFGTVFVRPTTLCTSGFGGIGICNGDSGGPLVVNRNGAPTLIGISSFVASAGCQLGHPSAFARVTSFMNFITQHM